MSDSPERSMRGGVDPSELGKKSGEARRRNREKSREEAIATAGDVDPVNVLREIANDKKNPAYARTQAVKALAQIAPEIEAEWKRSVQVRPDFTPPNWPEVLRFAVSIGAITKADFAA